MLNLPDMDALRVALDQPLADDLKILLEDRLADTLHCGLQHYTHVLVVEATDTEQQISDAIGFSPMETRIDGARNTADWDWIERRGRWWELLYTVGNDGFAFIVLVEDGSKSDLAMLCRKEAGA